MQQEAIQHEWQPGVMQAWCLTLHALLDAQSCLSIRRKVQAELALQTAFSLEVASIGLVNMHMLCVQDNTWSRLPCPFILNNFIYSHSTIEIAADA